MAFTGGVRDQVGDRLDEIAFGDLGDQSVKNVARRSVLSCRLQPDATTAPERGPYESDNDSRETVNRRAVGLRWLDKRISKRQRCTA